MIVLFKLMLAHAVTDYALQPFWLMQWKYTKLHARFAHALINAAGVYVVTQSEGIAFLELCVHFTIDTLKILKLINEGTDQALHYASKALYASVV